VAGFSSLLAGFRLQLHAIQMAAVTTVKSYLTNFLIPRLISLWLAKGIQKLVSPLGRKKTSSLKSSQMVYPEG